MARSGLFVLLLGVCTMQAAAVRQLADVSHEEAQDVIHKDDLIDTLDSDSELGMESLIEDEASDASADGPTTKQCMQFRNLDQDDVVDSIPGDVYVLLERKGLQQEYQDLTAALLAANKGKAGVWKGSAIARVMVVGGHEDAFEAKNVSIFFTKKERSGFFGKFFTDSVLKVCFVDRDEQKSFVPPNLYSDAKEVKVGHFGSRDRIELHRLPNGVVGQRHKDDIVWSGDMSTMPIDIIRLLKAKNCLLENMELISKINIAVYDTFWAAKLVSEFQEKFKAKGVGLFYNARKSRYACQCDDVGHCRTCTRDYFWIEYADLSVTGSSYSPRIQGRDVLYPSKKLEAYKQCKAGNAEALAVALAREAGQRRWGDCGDVAGAVERDSKKFPNCKCKEDNAKVFCGDHMVAGRKFDINTVLSLKGCEKRKAYCGAKACTPPSAL